MNKTIIIKLLSLILCLTMLTVASCDEDEDDDVKSSCDSSNYDPSSANYTCSNGYVAVGNNRCCPPNALYFCPTTGKCYTTCEAASSAGCGNVVYASSGGGSNSGGTTTGGGSTTGVCSTPYKHMSDAQLDAYCGAAYAYRCLDGKFLSDPGVQSVCNSYKLIKTSSAPDCPYCK